MNHIKEFVADKSHSLIVCKSISSIQEMFNALKFNWFDLDGCSIKRYLRENGNCSFSFNNGVCDESFYNDVACCDDGCLWW